MEDLQEGCQGMPDGRARCKEVPVRVRLGRRARRLHPELHLHHGEAVLLAGGEKQ